MGVSVMWFRRDLRLGDNPALTAAVERGPVLPLFVLDPVLVGTSGAPRLAYLYRSLRALDAALGGRLVVRHGDPAEVVAAAAAEVGADAVFLAADYGPYGQARDARVAAVFPRLVTIGSAYAVPPGTVEKPDGGEYRVFTPFSKAWRAHGWPAPCEPVIPEAAEWVEAPGDAIPADPPLGAASLPEAGERAATERLERFLGSGLDDYAERRNVPGVEGTSRLSVHLKFGEIHPRTILARLGGGHDVFRAELAWREFYADVLHHRPDSARNHWNRSYDAMRYDDSSAARHRFTAWTEGRTGYPIVDAGMRQLRAEAWMHNRVRMITASFLVKDLHCPWGWGARWFMQHLVDGDLASNNHGWQWVGGSGTDAAPYFRVFNPTAQGQRFDPGGTYVRRWVPELAGVAAGDIHDPARLDTLRGRLDMPAGLDDYPRPIVDHATERAEALARYGEVRSP